MNRIERHTPGTDTRTATATPLFVISTPRAGSTFLRGSLDAHPAITLTSEAGWIAALRKSEWLCRAPTLHPIDDGEGFQTFGVLTQRYANDVHAAFRVAARRFFGELAVRLGPRTTYFGDKIHSHNDAEFVIRMFPNARIVYLVRDLRDVLVSSYAFQQKVRTTWQDVGFEDRCRHLATFATRMAELLADREAIVVRYEELVAAPREHAASILERLGLELTPEVENWLGGDAATLFASHGTSSSPAASRGRWHSAFDSAQRATATELLRPALELLDYAAPLG